MRKEKHLFARMREKLDIPCEILPGGFGVIFSGNREMTVSGCRRILTYSEEEILLSLGKVQALVRGKGLLCTVFNAGSITLCGEIRSLSFLKEGEDAF